MNKKNQVLLLATLTLVGFSGIGILITFFSSSVSVLFINKESIFIQTIVGIAFGSLSAFVGWKIINLKPLKGITKKYTNLIAPLKLNNSEIIYISICAGVGEEILFRGAIQPLLGIWITSILFVAIHGYLSPTNWRLSIYGFYMTLIIVIMGYFTKHMGISTAIFAHIFIDIFLLYLLSNRNGYYK